MRSSGLSRVLCLALFWLAGCALHTPQSIGPPVEVPDAFAERQDEEGQTPLLERWWELFDDPHLNRWMDEVFAGNLELAQAVARIEQFEALSRGGASARRPVLDLQGSAGRARQPGIGGPVTDDSYRLSASAAFEIDLWQKLKSRSEAAKLDELASRRDLEALYLGLSARVADYYYLAVEQRAQLELTDRTIEAFAGTVELVERRYRAGLVPAIDVYQARQNLAAARARRPQFESLLATTEHALATLAGRYPQRSEGETLAQLPDAGALFPGGLPSQLLGRRPDLAAALARLQASDERVAAAIAERFPAFNLVGSYGGASSELGSLLDSGNIFWSLLLNLSQPVFDGGRRKAEVDRSRALFREKLAGYHQAVLGAFQEVEGALVRGRTSAERIGLLEAQTAAAEGSLRLATDRYRRGLTDYLPVLTAQGLTFDAQSRLLAARRQLIADRISLARSLGGGWMSDQVQQRLTLEMKEANDE